MVLVLTAVISFATIGSSLIYAMERSGFIALSSAVGAATSLLLAILLVPRLGVWGAVWCRLVVQWSMVALGTWFISRRLRFAFPFRALGRTLLAGLFCGAAAWGAVHAIPHPLAALTVAVPLGAAVYFVSVRQLCVLSSDELRRLEALAARLPAGVQTAIRILLHWRFTTR